MPTWRREVTAGTPIRATTDQATVSAIVSFINESSLLAVRVYDAGSESTPTAAACRANGLLLAPNNANQIQLQNLGGQRLDLWWLVLADEEEEGSAFVGVGY